MILSRIASKRNTHWALLALGVVILLCWGEQAGAVQNCPLHPDSSDSRALVLDLEPLEAPAQSLSQSLSLTLDSPTASELGDCDQTEQLLKAQTFSADLVLPTCLLLMWLIAGWLRRATPPRPPYDPIGSPRRRHLVLCVFRE